LCEGEIGEACGQRRIAGDALVIHPVEGAAVVSGFQVVPISAQVNPSWIGLFDESDFLFAPPAFELLLPFDSSGYLLICLKPDEAVTVVALRKTIMLAPFVLEDALLQVAGHADVERMAAACHDVSEVALRGHCSHGRWRVRGWQQALQMGWQKATARTTADPSTRFALTRDTSLRMTCFLYCFCGAAEVVPCYEVKSKSRSFTPPEERLRVRMTRLVVGG
jgi:hypothetical protein